MRQQIIPKAAEIIPGNKEADFTSTEVCSCTSGQQMVLPVSRLKLITNVGHNQCKIKIYLFPSRGIGKWQSIL